MHILCVGEAMAEIRGQGDGFAVGFAGDTFNTAVYAKRRMGAAGRVSYLTRLGCEALSEGFLRLARAEGIGVEAVARDGARNIGIYAVETDAAGERSFAYWRGQSAARMLFQDAADLAALEGCDILYLSGITLAILTPQARGRLLERVAVLRGRGVRFAFDSNYRPRLWEDAATARDVIGAAWALADVALPSLDDEIALFGGDEAAVLARLRAKGRIGALKRGAAGPVAMDAGVVAGGFAPAVRVVDTTAAGDSFNGGYLAALAMGLPEAERLRFGHETARHVVGQAGGIVDLPEGMTAQARRCRRAGRTGRLSGRVRACHGQDGGQR